MKTAEIELFPQGNTGVPSVLDACCGSRMFWFEKADPRALFVDKRREVARETSCQGTREIVVNPDVLADFQKLPFPDEAFSLVVFDPPHTFSGPNGRTAAKYGTLCLDLAQPNQPRIRRVFPSGETGDGALPHARAAALCSAHWER